jgi:hypothetical protein
MTAQEDDSLAAARRRGEESKDRVFDRVNRISEIRHQGPGILFIGHPVILLILFILSRYPDLLVHSRQTGW